MVSVSPVIELGTSRTKGSALTNCVTLAPKLARVVSHCTVGLFWGRNFTQFPAQFCSSQLKKR